MDKPTSRRQKFGSPDAMITRLKARHEKLVDANPDYYFNFYVRYGTECTEVVLGDTCFAYTSTKNFPREKLFLFNMVKHNADKWLKDKEDVYFPPEKNSFYKNLNYEDRNDKLVGIDLNHAYWRIAYVKGIINAKTYLHGLDEKVNVKALRLATLSVLGRQKKFIEYRNGVEFTEHIVQDEDQKRKKVFKYIRLVCFNMMHEISKQLKGDFESWKTDCIYFRDTPENRKLVFSYFDKKRMEYKILDYYPEKE